jgi:O-antigen/teichoic acid export membrane protein
VNQGRSWIPDPGDDLERRSVRGAAATVSSQGVVFVIRLVATSILARMLSPSDFGLVAMATPLVAFVILFEDLGLSMATVQRRELSEELVIRLFWVNVLAGLGLTVVTILCAPLVSLFFHDGRLTAITMALGSAFVIGGCGAQQRALLIRRMRFGFLSGLQIAAVATSAVCALAAALLGFGYWSLVVLTLANTFVISIGAWLVPQFTPRLIRSLRGAGDSIRFGLNYTGVGVLGFFARNMDNVLIGRYWGATELGYYSRAYSLLLQPLYRFHAPIETVVIPGLSRLQDDGARYARYYLRALSTMSTMALPAIVALMIASKDVVAVFLGPHWAPTVPMFAILGVTALLHTTYLTLAWLFVSLGRTGAQLRWSLISVPITIAGIAAGLPFGGLGVSIGYTAANLLLFLPGVWFATRKMPLRAREVLGASRQGALIATGVGVIVYLATLVPLSNAYVRFAIEAAAGLAAWSVLSLMVSEKDSPLHRVIGLAGYTRPVVRRRAATYIAAALVLLLALSEAIGRYALGLSGTAGFLNPWTGPLALVPTLAAFLWLFPARDLWRFVASAPLAFTQAVRTAAQTRSLRPFTALLRERLEWLLVVTGAISIVWAVFTALSASPRKGLRDLVYLWLMTLVFVVFTTLRDRGLIRTDRFVQALVIGFFVIIPVISLLVLKDAYARHRYSGLLFSPSVFAVVTSLVVQLSLTNTNNRWWRISAGALGLVLIGLSGTRSPFVAAIIFFAVWVFSRFFRLRVAKYVKVLVPMTLVAAGAAIVYFGQQFRVFQFTTWRFGSIPTRLSFYKGLISDMRGSFYIGGYGPGSAEARRNVLPHFDLLRFWHDYSVFGMLLWLLLPICMFYVALRHAGDGRVRRRLTVIAWAVWLFAMTLLASAHNIFQTPIGVVVFAVFVALIVPRPATLGEDQVA